MRHTHLERVSSFDGALKLICKIKRTSSHPSIRVQVSTLNFSEANMSRFLAISNVTSQTGYESRQAYQLEGVISISDEILRPV